VQEQCEYNAFAGLNSQLVLCQNTSTASFIYIASN